MFCAPFILRFLNCSPEIIQVTECRILASPAVGYGSGGYSSVSYRGSLR